MEPHFQVQDIAIEIKIFPAIRTLRSWILTKYLNKTEFFLRCEEQEIWKFEQPNLKNVCITFWMLMMDEKKLIIKLARPDLQSFALSHSTGILCLNSHCNISALKGSGLSELVHFFRKANQQKFTPNKRWKKILFAIHKDEIFSFSLTSG